MGIKKILKMIAALAAACLLTACGAETSVAEGSSQSGSVASSTERSASEASSAKSSESSPQSAPVSSDEAPAVSELPSSDSTPYTPPNNDRGGEVSESILVLDGGQGLMLYGMDSEIGRRHAAAINRYKEELGANVNVFSMIVPTQLSFYLPEKYSELSDDELSHIEDINGYYDGIIPIDVFSALKGHVGEDIYYRTDHHWTQLGAYYAAQAFAKTALVPFDELSEYEKHEKDGYLGSFYGGSGEHPEIKKKPETFMWYIPKREVVTTYYDQKGENGYEGNYFFEPEDFYTPSHWLFTYMSGDGNIVHVDTGLDTGRRLMLLKDSYADSFAPCLFGSFDEIWIADMRYCDISAVEFAKEREITDLLFCCSAYSAMGDNRTKLVDVQRKLEDIM